MFEAIMHFIGLCPDSMSHPNLIVALASFASGWFGVRYLIRSLLPLFFHKLRSLVTGQIYEPTDKTHLSREARLDE